MRCFLATILLAMSLNTYGQLNPPPPGAPPPPVPLDGGLVALIGAGAALGYKKYKENRPY